MAASTTTACRWTDALVSLLLEALRARESLWNSRSENYKNRNTKKKEYEEILDILREDWPDVDLPAIKSKANVFCFLSLNTLLNKYFFILYIIVISTNAASATRLARPLLMNFAILLCTLAFHGHLCCAKLLLTQINNKYLTIIYTSK